MTSFFLVRGNSRRMMVLRIENTNEVVLGQTFEKTTSFEAAVDKVPITQSRWIIMNYEWTANGQARKALILIVWVPVDTPFRDLYLNSANKTYLKGQMRDIVAEFEVINHTHLKTLMSMNFYIK